MLGRLLLVSTGLVGALRVTNLLHSPTSSALHRAHPVLAVAVPDDVRECIVDAENAGEIAECLSGEPAVSTTSSPARDASMAPLTDEDRKAALLGSAESLAECLWDAENPSEIAACRDDFEELIGVPTGACNEEGKCNPEEIKVVPATELAGASRAGGVQMCVPDTANPRFGPGKCIFRGDKCTGKRCKVNNAPCKDNHASM
uniref:Uncharacterized protein n=1 Tax=Coccolithus braarudii TaxID=221442 RepID=A0A7S0LMU5_9EUKA|mmetsp:Transcript_49190/g.105044  ORF Transcript_49190/g.105044 Transcript_49190/m.105044 type:complete len:202 (+) Transcript_49190:61-666(+)